MYVCVHVKGEGDGKREGGGEREERKGEGGGGKKEGKGRGQEGQALTSALVEFDPRGGRGGGRRIKSR